MMSPVTLMAARNRPRPGTCMNRSPSYPVRGSSVTSKRNMGQPRRAAANSAPVPGFPDQEHSARRVMGSAGCGDHSKRTGDPRTRAIAHSTWGTTASGAEWTYTTPRLGTAGPPEDEARLPLRPRLTDGAAAIHLTDQRLQRRGDAPTRLGSDPNRPHGHMMPGQIQLRHATTGRVPGTQRLAGSRGDRLD